MELIYFSSDLSPFATAVKYFPLTCPDKEGKMEVSAIKDLSLWQNYFFLNSAKELSNVLLSPWPNLLSWEACWASCWAGCFFHTFTPEASCRNRFSILRCKTPFNCFDIHTRDTRTLDNQHPNSNRASEGAESLWHWQCFPQPALPLRPLPGLTPCKHQDMAVNIICWQESPFKEVLLLGCWKVVISIEVFFLLVSCRGI